MGKTAIIGFGCAGYHAAEALRAHSPDSLIDVFTENNEAPSNPMLTTYYASGKIPEVNMYPFGGLREIAERLNLQIFTENPVKSLNATDREVVLTDGSRRHYDDIVIATGADALIPPIPGMPQRGVFAMRTSGDARKIAAALDDTVKSALVIGASMVGIKVVEILLKRGIKTTLADMAPYIFPLSALEDVAEIIHARLLDKGIDLLFGHPIESFQETADGIVSTFQGGESVTSDVVVFCMGTRARLSICNKDELDIGRGIKVDLNMRTNVPHVYAVGDCCETTNVQSGQSMIVGLWANAVKQGQVAGMNIAGESAEYQGNLIHNITHFLDMDFISIGDNRIKGERISFQHSREGWMFEAISNGDEISCINILDNEHISGPVKNILLKHVKAPKEKTNVMTKLVLRKSGLPVEIVERLTNE